jgi:hypothetical protein
MKLSKNFYLSEFTKSSTAKRLGIENEPDISHVFNIKQLVDNLLQPIRNKIGAIRITSGYRNPELSVAIGSSESSQHCKGQAVDMQYHIDGTMQNKTIFDAIIEHGDFDQLIEEFNFSWIHVSYNMERNRKQVLKAIKENNKTKYIDITNQFASL